MPRVVCIDWTEDDEACGAREAGWSLHISIEDATRQIRKRVLRHFGHGEPYSVYVPEEVYEEVRRSQGGIFKSLPRECPYARVVD